MGLTPAVLCGRMDFIPRKHKTAQEEYMKKTYAAPLLVTRGDAVTLTRAKGPNSGEVSSSEFNKHPGASIGGLGFNL
jgi:hypothetical protein